MAIRKADWKLVKMYPGGNADETSKLTLEGASLFNLAQDISEQNDLASAQPEKVRDLSATWLRWREQLHAPLWDPPQGYRGMRRSCLDPALARPAGAYAGTWRGSFAAGVPLAWLQRTDGSGTIQLGADTTITATRLLHASSDSLVVDVTSPVRSGTGEMARLTLVGYVCGDELTGWMHVLRPNGNGDQRNTIALVRLIAGTQSRQTSPALPRSCERDGERRPRFRHVVTLNCVSTRRVT